MRTLTAILVLSILFFSNKLRAQTQNITATVVNVTSDSGKVSYALYDKASFRKQPLQAMSSTIKEGKSTVVFKNIAAGEYAVICYHDKNNNDKMDFEPSGMPMEDYGVSTNNINRFGPPMYEQIKFVVADKNVTLEIKL